MFEIEFDQRAFDKVIMNAITEQVTKKVEDAVGAANAGKMKVKIKGRDLKNLSMEVEGPEELIEKVRKVLQ